MAHALGAFIAHAQRFVDLTIAVLVRIIAGLDGGIASPLWGASPQTEVDVEGPASRHSGLAGPEGEEATLLASARRVGAPLRVTLGAR